MSYLDEKDPIVLKIPYKMWINVIRPAFHSISKKSIYSDNDEHIKWLKVLCSMKLQQVDLVSTLNREAPLLTIIALINNVIGNYDYQEKDKE